MKRICLITHCEATHTIENKVGGWFDSELTIEGERRASQLLSKISRLGFDGRYEKIYSSDLKRAHRTAQILSESTKLKLVLDRRLREMSFGKHEGMSLIQHKELMIPLSSSDDRMDHRICEGAESRRELAMRIVAFVNEIMESNHNEVIVTHGFAATFVIAAFQQIDMETLGYINYKLSPGSISILEEDDVFKNRSVTLLNG